MGDKDIMFEVLYEGDDDSEYNNAELHTYYVDGIAVIRCEGEEETTFVWRLKDCRVQYWQDGYGSWMDDNDEVQQEYQAWINRQITEDHDG